jgi:hypothetical protein
MHIRLIGSVPNLLTGKVCGLTNEMIVVSSLPVCFNNKNYIFSV